MWIRLVNAAYWSEGVENAHLSEQSQSHLQQFRILRAPENEFPMMMIVQTAWRKSDLSIL
jgi:hypothetical protein